IARFGSNFAETRKRFQTAVEATFSQRTLSDQLIGWPRFRRFVQSFQNENQSCPVTSSLAEAWAQGKADDDLQAEIISRFCSVFGNYVVPDDLSQDACSDSPYVRLIALANQREPATADSIERQSTLIYRTNLVSLVQARSELQNAFSAD